MERISAGVEVSQPVESEPWGYESDKAFVNAGLTLRSTADPSDLLQSLQAVEREISPAPHRDASGAYIDRLIDIDLIACGEAVVSTPTLTLPHPAMTCAGSCSSPWPSLCPSGGIRSSTSLRPRCSPGSATDPEIGADPQLSHT